MKPLGPLPVVFTEEGRGLPLPHYQTKGSVGMDLYAAHDAWVPIQDRVMVRCGIKIAVPDGFELQIRSRSGLALKSGIICLNAPGTIDSDYRGEVCVILYNASVAEPFRIMRGDRIAQGVLASVWQAAPYVVDSLNATDRGESGFGSTGVRP